MGKVKYSFNRSTTIDYPVTLAKFDAAKEALLEPDGIPADARISFHDTEDGGLQIIANWWHNVESV
jgi:hypothetical protein